MGKRGYKSREPYKIKRCVIALDQSYARTGIAIAVDGKLKKIKSIDFKRVHNKTNKRNLLRETLRNAINSCLKKFDASEYGGAPLLGLNGLVVKAHGSSSAKEMKNAIIQCIAFAEEDITQKIKDQIVKG